MRWYVLHLKPRTEKKLAEYSSKLGLSHYLPLRQETKVYQRRKVTVQKPVFPGYFFVAFDQRSRQAILSTNHVVRIMDVTDQRLLLHELAQVRKALDVDATLGAVEALTAGRMVRITAGPFMGVEGMVSGLKGPNAVRLNVDLIGQAIAVEVDKDYLEVLD
jgi:transcription antitermination factor NusG